jgi:long-chain acyl-CoA synthetase
VRGPDTLPLRHETVVHALADAAAQAPDATALVCGDETLDYRGYAACVEALAGELAPLGTRGDRVALLMGNSLDIAIATFAVQAAGFQVVPLNPAYTAHELDPIVANAAPVALIHDEGCAAAALDAARARGVRHLLPVGPGTRLTRWRDRPLPAGGLPRPRADELSTLQYTGGTTGRSKGVDLTHAAVSINVSQREALLPTEPRAERVLAVTPLFHVYAVSMGLYLAAYCRGTLVILPRYRPEWVLEAIERHRITLFSGSPTLFTGLMAYEHFARHDLSSLRLCYSGSAALPQETLRRWEQATGCGVVEGYGQSEAGPVLTYNPREGVRKIGDRKKDMVIVGGYNVYPREVEEALYTHPAVIEAAVVGVPDSYRGEALVAFVVCRPPQPSDEALREHLAGRLVRYKIPGTIRLVGALPKTVVGKTDKTRLRSEARDTAGA